MSIAGRGGKMNEQLELCSSSAWNWLSFKLNEPSLNQQFTLENNFEQGQKYTQLIQAQIDKDQFSIEQHNQ